MISRFFSSLSLALSPFQGERELTQRFPKGSDAVALAAGLLLPLAFAPFDFYPLAFIAPAILFLLWRGTTPGRAAWRGFLFGIGMFGLGVSWVYVSMHRFGNMPMPLAGLATVLFVAGMSLYPAVYGWLQARFFPERATWHRVLVLPLLWVLFEWTRGWFLTGFPWLNLGYSQVSSSLSGYAAWVGVYGVSFITALSAGVLAEGVHTSGKFFRCGVPILILLWAGGWLAGKVDWVQPVNGPVRVTLVQGNVPLEQKWRPEYRQVIMERYMTMSSQAPPSDLIVWPEGSIPAYVDDIDSGYLETLRRTSRATKTDFLLGVHERDGKKLHYYNSVIGIGSQPGSYRKQHLVPFGEYPPWPALFGWLMRYWQIPMSDLSSGAADQPLLSAAGQKIALSICYEDAFGEEVIRALPTATLLVNVSEDAWFGRSLAPHQRVQMARMRALETGRPLLRAANTGPSVIIDSKGAVVARSPVFQQYLLSATVQPSQGATPYVRFGNMPVLLLLALGLTILNMTNAWKDGKI